MEKYIILTDKPNEVVEVQVSADGRHSWNWTDATAPDVRVKSRNPLGKIAMRELRQEAKFFGLSLGGVFRVRQ